MEVRNWVVGALFLTPLPPSHFILAECYKTQLCFQDWELRDDGSFFFDVIPLLWSDGSYNIQCYITASLTLFLARYPHTIEMPPTPVLA